MLATSLRIHTARSSTARQLGVRCVATSRPRAMPAITPNVAFDTVAREWRLKWSADSDKQSLSAVQSALEAVKVRAHLTVYVTPKSVNFFIEASTYLHIQKQCREHCFVSISNASINNLSLAGLFVRVAEKDKERKMNTTF